MDITFNPPLEAIEERLIVVLARLRLGDDGVGGDPLVLALVAAIRSLVLDETRIAADCVDVLRVTPGPNRRSLIAQCARGLIDL